MLQSTARPHIPQKLVLLLESNGQQKSDMRVTSPRPLLSSPQCDGSRTRVTVRAGALHERVLQRESSRLQAPIAESLGLSTVVVKVYVDTEACVTELTVVKCGCGVCH